ncbi:RNA 2',3'-cyclic phosphodiesterase [Planctomycetota bacterium]
MSIRCFIAIELNDAIQRKLGRLQNRLGGKLHHPPGITWVKPDHMHLTLKFLGDVDDTVINDVCSAASEAAAQVVPFEFELGSVGCFGSAASTRVIWVGVTTGLSHLEKLHQSVDKQLAQIGFPPERRKFSPHLTLARVRNVKVGSAVRPAVDKLEPISFSAQNVSEITVFQSDLSSGGPVHTPLHHAPLKL